MLFLLTDGCRAQYRGCKAFEFYSQLNEKYGVCFVHMLGIPHKFKGPHDSFGFVFKDKMNRIILSLPENFTVSSPKAINLAWPYFKLAFDRYPQPKATNTNLQTEYTIDHVTILYSSRQEYRMSLCSTLYVYLCNPIQFSYTHPPIKKVSCIVHIAKEIVFVSWGRRVMVKTSGDDTETTICNAMFPAFLDTCLPGEAARAKPDLHCPAIRIATTL